MKKLLVLASLLAAVPAAQAQVQVLVPAGSQQNPTWGASIHSPMTDFWMGDRAGGFVHYVQNPNVPGQFMIDPDPFRTDFIGGPAANCLPFCVLGSIAQVSNTLAFIFSSDPQKPQNGFIRGAGIYQQQFVPGSQPPAGSLGNTTTETITKGVANDLPQGGALGPDGKVYYVGSGNPNLRRLTNPLGDVSSQQVETYGTALNGQRPLAGTFNGSDFYIATGDGFYIVPNAPACNGNQNNCGRPALIAGGAMVAVVSDGISHVYFASALGVVSRYTPTTQSIVQVASGFSFTAGVPAGLGFNGPGGDLIIGQASEIDLIASGVLATLP